MTSNSRARNFFHDPAAVVLEQQPTDQWLAGAMRRRWQSSASGTAPIN
jgi:hypothetical protein